MSASHRITETPEQAAPSTESAAQLAAKEEKTRVAIAIRQAQTITEYWHSRGHTNVNVRVRPIAGGGCEVRSNLVKGMPPGVWR
jgi:hypothetical protein